ncbi:TPA: hypothetical protein L4B13_006493 [Pseudomonas aeruginosa]|nr:hypothetical protein [Pseudomonas aeruginosa]
MTESKICTCPSGDGSLVHPCPAHPAVEQAGGDERAVDGKPRATKCPDYGEGDLMPGDLCACGYETDPAAGYACSECDGSGDGYVGEVCRECDGSGWFVTPEQARAALAQPSGEVVVTKNESGAIVSVTRQDKEGRVLSVIAESATLTAQAEQAEAERPEVVATMYTHHDDVDFREFVVVGNCDKGCEGFYGPEKLMTVAQHERIVGELRSDRDSWAEQAEQRLADWDEMRKERDAALARVAELERQEPVALANRGLHAFWVKWTEAAAGLYGPGIKLYAAPVVQAQQLHDLDKQCRDDVARALGLRPNQERGFAWSYLLASIKSCVKASEDSAQAQHSVPGDIMRDAQRYRWLRDQQFYFSFSTENSDAGISSCTAGMSSRFKNLSWVDAAIDSAIAAAPGKEGV